jgi:hypothetical protein
MDTADENITPPEFEIRIVVILISGNQTEPFEHDHHKNRFVWHFGNCRERVYKHLARITKIPKNPNLIFAQTPKKE